MVSSQLLILFYISNISIKNMPLDLLIVVCKCRICLLILLEIAGTRLILLKVDNQSKVTISRVCKPMTNVKHLASS